MPALGLFRKVLPDDDADAPMLARVMVDLANAIADAFGPLNANPRARSVVQRNVVIGATATLINHKLSLGAGKNPNGWAIIDIDTNATVKRTAWDATTITLTASAACVAALEVW